MRLSSHLAILLIVLTCSLMSTSRAAAQQTARFGLQAGATVPVGTYASDKDTGYHLGLLVDVRSPESFLGFRVEGAYHELKYSANSTRAETWTAGGDLLLKIPTSTPVLPYAIGGVGIYSSRRSLLISQGYSTDLGVNVGGGLRFEFGDAITFVEARYHRAGPNGGIRFVPITIGLLF